MKLRNREALHILGLSSSVADLPIKEAIDAITLAYRKACSTYHPDRNPAGLKMMQLVNAAWDALQDVVRGGFFDDSVKRAEKSGAENYGEDLNSALNAIVDLGLTVEICGAWVWVSGDTKPHAQTLKAAGYRWAPVKKMWHYRPAEYKSFSRGKWSMNQIRERYGSNSVRRSRYTQLEAS